MVTYHDQLFALGQEVDDRIAGITGQPSSGVHAGQGASLGTAWDADVAAAKPPPPPPPKILAGASPGAWGTVAALISALNLAPRNIIRCFSPADGKTVPAGFAIAYSNDGGHNRGADLDGIKKGSAAYTAWLTELRSVFRNDDAPGWVVADHEFDIHSNDYAAVAREYVGLNMLLDDLNVGRTNKILSAVVTTGMVYDSTAYQKLEQIPAAMVGVDNYARKHWDTLAAFGKRIGKPYGCFENGIKAQTNPSLYTDAQVSSALTADFGQASSLGFSLFCYWPNGGNDLTHRPQSTANLAAICKANR